MVYLKWVNFGWILWRNYSSSLRSICNKRYEDCVFRLMRWKDYQMECRVSLECKDFWLRTFRMDKSTYYGQIWKEIIFSWWRFICYWMETWWRNYTLKILVRIHEKSLLYDFKLMWKIPLCGRYKWIYFCLEYLWKLISKSLWKTLR